MAERIPSSDNISEIDSLNIYSFSKEDCHLFSWKGMFLLILLALALLGCFTNLTFIYVVVKQPSLRKGSLVVYLVTLSIVDIAICVSYIVLIFWCKKLADRALPEKIILFLFANPDTLHVLSIILILLIARERYNAVSEPLNVFISNLHLPKKHIVVVPLFMLVSFLVLDTLYIVFVPFDNIYVTIWVYMPLDGVSLILSLSLYVVIFYRVKRRQGFSTTGESHLHSDRNRHILMNVTKGLFATTVTFFVLVFVQDVIYFSVYSDKTVDPSVIGVVTFVWVYLAILNSSINPIIYNIFGSIFRHALLETFPCLRLQQCRKTRENPLTNNGTTTAM